MSDLVFLGIGLIAGLLLGLIVVALLVLAKLNELSTSLLPQRDDDGDHLR